MSKLNDSNFPSVNALSAPIVQSLIDNADALRLGVSKMSNGTTVIDAGIDWPDTKEPGVRCGHLHARTNFQNLLRHGV